MNRQSQRCGVAFAVTVAGLDEIRFFSSCQWRSEVDESVIAVMIQSDTGCIYVNRPVHILSLASSAVTLHSFLLLLCISLVTR
jgi:hypothetical protein